jgi:hypothetical protein
MPACSSGFIDSFVHSALTLRFLSAAALGNDAKQLLSILPTIERRLVGLLFRMRAVGDDHLCVNQRVAIEVLILDEYSIVVSSAASMPTEDTRWDAFVSAVVRHQ